MISSITLLLAFCIIYIFIIEIFTVLFRLTGLSEEKARFQVISLLTACGFTTSQSEAITITKQRRKLASLTMLFGYIFSLIIVSIVVNIFLNLSMAEINTFLGVGVTLVSVFIVIFILIKSKTAKIYFDKLINAVYIKLSKNKENNIIIIDAYANRVMVNMNIKKLPDFLVNVELKDSGLKLNYQIQILVIKRDGHIIEYINGNTILKPEDDLIVFGPEKNIYTVFKGSIL